MTPEEIKLYGEPLFNKGDRACTTATHRRCNGCKQWKEYSEFHKDKSRSPQIVFTCKTCASDSYITKRRAKFADIEARFGRVLPSSHGTATETYKKCSKCGEGKEHSQFGQNNANLFNLQNACKPCVHNVDLQKRYRISLEDYTTLLAKQGGGCAICGAAFAHANTEKLFVDHDHETNDVRGLLCHCCNAMLGYARDNPDTLRRGIQYLERSAK